MKTIKPPLVKLKAFAKKNVPEPIFICLSGSHAYGFPSPDSDYDLRGAHVINTERILGLKKPGQTLEQKEEQIELVTHEVEKFLGLLLSPSGYSLEQIWSPYPVLVTSEFKKLKELSKNIISKKLHAHYSGFAVSLYKKAKTANWSDVKENLYLLRVLMSGIILLEKGKVEVNLPTMNKQFKFDIVDELIQAKLRGEKVRKEISIEKEAADLFKQLDEAYKNSKLPDDMQNFDAFNDFLLKIRMKNL